MFAEPLHANKVLQPHTVAWFDFVLQPSKLDEHLAQLAAEKTTTPTGASSADAAGKQGDAARTPLRPTALELTTLFLEKAVEKGAVGPLEPAAGGDDGDGLQLPTPDAFSKRQQCLLRLAARVAEPAGLRSLAQKEEALPERVQLALLVALTWHAPAADAYRHRCDVHRWHLRRVLPCSSCPASSSATAAAASASASSSSCSTPPPTPATLAAAERFICRALDAADAATSADATQMLSPADQCVLSYDVGEYHFSQSAFGPSAQYLRRAQQLLTTLPPEDAQPVPTERLHGFLTACALVQPDAAAAAAADNVDASPLLACERARHAGDVPAILACLRIPLAAQGRDSLPAGYRSALEEDSRLDRHARACVTAVNVVHEMISLTEDTEQGGGDQGGGAPPEVTLRLVPYVTASRECSEDDRQRVVGAFIDAVDAAMAVATTDERSRRRLRRAVALLCEHCDQLPAGLQTRAAKYLSSKCGGGGAAAVAAESHVPAHASPSSMVPPRRLLQAAGAWQSPTFALSRWLSAHDTPLSTGFPTPSAPPSKSESTLPAPSAAVASATKRPREEGETTAEDRPSKRQSTQQQSGKAGGGSAGGGGAAGSGPESTARGALQALQTALTSTDMASTTSALFSPLDADVTARVLARCLDAPEAAWPVLRRLTTEARERNARGTGAAAAATTTEAEAEAAHVALLGVAAALARCSEGATDAAASMTPYETLWHLLFCHFPSMHPTKKGASPAPSIAASHETIAAAGASATPGTSPPPSAPPAAAVTVGGGTPPEGQQPAAAAADVDMEEAEVAEAAARWPYAATDALELLLRHVRNEAVLRTAVRCLVGCAARLPGTPSLRLETYGPRVMLLAGDAGCSAVPQNSKPARTHRGTEAATEAEARDRSSPAFLVFKLAQAALVRQVYVQGQRPSPRCLLALADLSACYGGDPRVVLRCSLRAAASCSRFFAVQEACLPASVFQPAVIRAMINACASLKLAVPAAVLCQLLLPTPDFSTAFTLLKTTPAARLDADYFEFLWEVPLLELLTHLHTLNGNRTLVARLLALIQRPALCVHNSNGVQAAAIAALKQKFLNKLWAQLCDA